MQIKRTCTLYNKSCFRILMQHKHKWIGILIVRRKNRTSLFVSQQNLPWKFSSLSLIIMNYTLILSTFTLQKKGIFFFLSSYVKNLTTSYRYKISIQGSIYEYQRGVMTSKDQIKLFWRVHLITWRTRVSKSGTQYNETDQVRPKNFITYHCSICKDLYFDYEILFIILPKGADMIFSNRHKYMTVL